MTKDLSNCCKAPLKESPCMRDGQTIPMICSRCNEDCGLDVQIPIQNYTWEDSYPLNTFAGQTKQELITLISRIEQEARADIAQECYLQCLAVECGEGECAEAIRTKFPDLVTNYEI